MSEQSESINELATALATAQGKITGALKDSANPFFKSKYADLASVWDACRGPLSENGLAVVQTTEPVPEGVMIVTTLAHKSGQWMRGKMLMRPKDDSPQAAGSAITYGRRYALAAIIGVAQIDDDGNAASGKTDFHSPKPEGWNRQDSVQTTKYKKLIDDALKEGRDVLELWDEVRSGGEEFATAVWSKLTGPVKDHIKDQVAKRDKSAA